MENNANRSGYQMLVTISTPKIADRAAELFVQKSMPIVYRMNAQGTASSEVMDALGLVSTDRCMLVSCLPRSVGGVALKLLHTELRLDTVNSGIAFTMPLTGASNLMLRMMTENRQSNDTQNDRKDETTMSDTNKHVLITAIVNRGYADGVMISAREAGAGGGTIVHSRCIANEESAGFWGLGVQEEKEIVLIIARTEDKLKIMSAISEKHGSKTDAKGLVCSLPIDSVMGIE